MASIEFELTNSEGSQKLVNLLFGASIDKEPKINLEARYKKRERAGTNHLQWMLHMKSNFHRPKWYRRNNAARLCWKTASENVAIFYGVALEVRPAPVLENAKIIGVSLVKHPLPQWTVQEVKPVG